MADYFEHMCIALPCDTAEKRAWWERVDEALQSAFDDDSEHQEFLEELLPEEARDCTVCEISFEQSDGEDLVFLTDDAGVLQTDGLTGILQAYLRKFEPEGLISGELAFTCSKPRLDAYAGAAFAVTATQAEWATTADLVLTLRTRVGRP